MAMTLISTSFLNSEPAMEFPKLNELNNLNTDNKIWTKDPPDPVFVQYVFLVNLLD